MTEEKIYELLKAWRLEESRVQNIFPFVIFHDTVLKEIAEKKPTTLEEVSGIKGIGVKKIEQYGIKIIDIVQGTYMPSLYVEKIPTPVKKASIQKIPKVSLKKEEEISIIQKAREIAILNFLSPRLLVIVNSRYPLVGESKTLEEIGTEFGVTRERIRQLEKKAIRKLKGMIRKHEKGVFIIKEEDSTDKKESRRQRILKEYGNNVSIVEIENDNGEKYLIKNFPKNHGRPWLQEEIQRLVEEYTKNPNPYEVAVLLERSSKSVFNKLVKLELIPKRLTSE
ncbi:MAG TPA: HRDC domain-containing protein [Candidatus Saccharimonadales bacterium]|nr:HRDC domain-containing protein [Candidatus Saccharimonadales bacterium]